MGFRFLTVYAVSEIETFVNVTPLAEGFTRFPFKKVHS